MGTVTATQYPHNWEELVRQLEHIAEQKGITQSEIATRTGLFQSNISRVFLLKYVPTLKTITLIANAIGAEIKIEEAKQ
jgi:transcriptional regulator with XRE-family HTH domain